MMFMFSQIPKHFKSESDNHTNLSVELDPEESMSFADAPEVTCNGPGPMQIEVMFESVSDGARLIDITIEIECFE